MRLILPDHTGRWQTEIRDPANTARWTDPRTIGDNIEYGHVTAAYIVAPIPAGWARQSEAWADYRTGSCTPWVGPYPTRHAAEDAALNHLAHFLTTARDEHPKVARALDWVAGRRQQEGLF